jgi:hypothetical protein
MHIVIVVLQKTSNFLKTNNMSRRSALYLDPRAKGANLGHSRWEWFSTFKWWYTYLNDIVLLETIFFFFSSSNCVHFKIIFIGSNQLFLTQNPNLLYSIMVTSASNRLRSVLSLEWLAVLVVASPVSVEFRWWRLNYRLNLTPLAHDSRVNSFDTRWITHFFAVSFSSIQWQQQYQ